MKVVHLLLTGLFFCQLLVSCSDPGENGLSQSDGSSNNVHVAGWLNPQNANFHGSQAATTGANACGSCHGLDLQGSGAVPGCNECHLSLTDFNRNSPDGVWIHGSLPHDQFLTQGATCNNCHDALRQFPGQGPANCHDCHDTGGHPVGQAWLDKNSAQFHGLAATADLTSCATCHGSDFLGGSSGVSCSACHCGPSGSKNPPNEGTWSHGTTPHNSANFTAAIAICNQCHTTSRLYNNGPNSCHDCHISASHPLGQAWLDKNSSTFHGAAATAELASCATCHGSDYLGGSSGVSCSACHFGPSGSKNPPNEGTWSHGATPHNSANFTAAIAICNQCHTTSRLYNNGPNSCHDCHVSASHPLGQTWLDKNSQTFHGNAATADVVSCQPCHGSDLLGGSSGVSCSACHFGPSGSRVPAGQNWSHGSIPHNSLTPYTATCNQCHDQNRLYGNAPATCHDCHAEATHPLGQAWLDKTSSSFHGSAAQADVDSCAVCHGSDFQGGSAGRSCYECHFGPTGSKNPPNEGTWSHGTTPHNSANFTAAIAICNQCHTTSRLYNNGPNSCHDCHGSGGHPVGQVWLDSASASFHGDAATADLNSCRTCHGTNLDGGSAGVSCETCHFGPSGSRVPTGVSWTHGTTHTGLAAYEPTCNQCHSLTRQYRNAPSASCHDCHGSGVPHAVGAAWLLPSAHAQSSINDRASCLSCHALSGATGTQPSCGSCHIQADPPTSLGACTSCHAKPPRTGQHRDHDNFSCQTCHNAYGSGSLNHYYPNPAAPADIQFLLNSGDTLSASFDGNGNLQSCANSCHGENHGSNRSW